MEPSHYDPLRRARQAARLFLRASQDSAQDFAETMIQIVEECAAKQTCARCDKPIDTIEPQNEAAPESPSLSPSRPVVR